MLAATLPPPIAIDAADQPGRCLGKREAPPPSPDIERQVRSVSVLRVPAGASSRDSVALYDTSRQAIARERVPIPENAFEGACTAYEQPHPRLKLILLDGDGYTVGGSAAEQHAARLRVHHGLCVGEGCCVFGCGTSFFDDLASPEACAGYEEHWRRSRKAALRAHERSLKLKAAVWQCGGSSAAGLRT